MANMYTEPASQANAITYLYFCTLGGLTNPRCRKVMRVDGRGTFTHYTYHLLSY